MEATSNSHLQIDGNIPENDQKCDQDANGVEHSAGGSIIIHVESSDRVMKEHSEDNINLEERVDQDANFCDKECEEEVLGNDGWSGERREKECVRDNENDKFDDQESSAVDDTEVSFDHECGSSTSNDSYATVLHQGHKNDLELSDENDVEESVADDQLKCDATDVKLGSASGSVEDDKINDVNKSILVTTAPPVKCIGHYNNHQKILLVGEGDFSFAASLATAFGYASNLTATSLDSRYSVITEYSRAAKNLMDLEERGVVVIHNVDVQTMNNNPQLKDQRCDRIVFNFPHAGGKYGSCREHETWYIECHKEVVKWFFETASQMLSKDGEIHVTHKTAHPFDRWDIVSLAELAGLKMSNKKVFHSWDYPGYRNKKAYGSCWDATFPVGECCTFMFSIT